MPTPQPLRQFPDDDDLHFLFLLRSADTQIHSDLEQNKFHSKNNNKKLKFRIFSFEDRKNASIKRFWVNGLENSFGKMSLLLMFEKFSFKYLHTHT